MRSSQRGSAQARAAEDAQQRRDQDEPDEHGVEQDGDAEDDAHLLGRQRPGEGEGEEDGDHDRGGGEDDAAGVGEPADHRLARVARAVEVLLGRGEQEQGVVHRDREDHREEEDRPPGVEEALRLEAEQAGAVAVLEDQPGDAEGGAGREQVRQDAERGDQRRLQRDEQEQEAEREHDADHERRLRGERLLEVVVLGRGAADERRGGSADAEPVDRASDGGARGVGVRDRLDQREAVGCPAGRARRGRCRGRAWRRPTTAAASRCGRDDLERAGRADAEGLLHLRVADPRAVVGRDDLDRGHPRLQPDDGKREQHEDQRRGGAVEVRVAPEPLAPAGEARGAVLAGVHPAERERVDPRAELREHGGQQRQRRGEHEDDAEHDPERHRAEGRARDEHHRRERDQHREAGEEDGLAGGVHRHGDRVAGVERRAEEGAAEAVHDEERVVDPEREREHEREVHRPDRDLERRS